jgi:hypothetical protein
MKNVALAQLQRQIEAVRHKAYAEGYAAAMRRVYDFAARTPDGPNPVRTAPPVPPLAQSGRSGRTPAATGDRPRMPRPPHGAQIVAAVLKSIAPRAARPSEIRHLLLCEHGVALPFTSIRHALGQLAARHAAEQVAESKTWRHLPAHGAAGASDG